jgi:hypothetical protein
MIRYIHPWPSGPVQLYVEGNIVYAMNGRPVFVIEGQYFRQSPGGKDLFRISDKHIYKCGEIGNPAFYFG